MEMDQIDWDSLYGLYRDYWVAVIEKRPCASGEFEMPASARRGLTNPTERDSDATSESRAQYEALQDVWDRKRRLLLETFVTNPSVDVRRSIIPSLNLDPQDYAEGHRSLVIAAIEIARSHDDNYIRHRVEIQLGNTSGGYAPLPHRQKPTPA